MPRNVSTILYIQNNLALNFDTNIVSKFSYDGTILSLSNIKESSIRNFPFVVNNPAYKNSVMTLIDFEVYLQPPGGVQNTEPTIYPGLFDSVRRQIETSDVINFIDSKVTHRPFTNGFGPSSKSIIDTLNCIASVNTQLPQNINSSWGVTFRIVLDPMSYQNGVTNQNVIVPDNFAQFINEAIALRQAGRSDEFITNHMMSVRNLNSDLVNLIFNDSLGRRVTLTPAVITNDLVQYYRDTLTDYGLREFDNPRLIGDPTTSSRILILRREGRTWEQITRQLTENISIFEEMRVTPTIEEERSIEQWGYYRYLVNNFQERHFVQLFREETGAWVRNPLLRDLTKPRSFPLPELVIPAHRIPNGMPPPVSNPVPVPVSNPVPVPVSNPVPLPVSNPVPLPVFDHVPLHVFDHVPLPVSNPVHLPVFDHVPLPVFDHVSVPSFRYILN
jgi:hypothetical protein